MVSQTLVQLIDEACVPERKKADFSLNLDICDLVKSKISHARTAVNHLAKLINQPNLMKCYLALNLLDLLVINCGYPVHLVVSKKDFLNKLVYRFPPIVDDSLDKCHYIIMSLLKKWSLSLAERSKYREDFGNIKLMVALLKNKGFPVPEVEPEAINAIVANEEAQLRSKEELEREERLVHEARLEELLHRGTPADLVAANELMKRLVGYSDDPATSTYSLVEAQIDHELNLLGDKIDLLSSMMEKGETFEAYSSLYEECKAAVPRLFHLANSELSEAVMMKLLALNQRLNEVVGSEASTPSLKNDCLHMDMLIDLEAQMETEAANEKAGKKTRDIMELFKAETPKLGPAQVKLEYYAGTGRIIVDTIRVDGTNYLRAFNSDQANEIVGVEIEGQVLGRIGPLQTVTAPLENNLNMNIKVRFQQSGRQLSENQSVVL